MQRPSRAGREAGQCTGTICVGKPGPEMRAVAACSRLADRRASGGSDCDGPATAKSGRISTGDAVANPQAESSGRDRGASGQNRSGSDFAEPI